MRRIVSRSVLVAGTPLVVLLLIIVNAGSLRLQLSRRAAVAHSRAVMLTGTQLLSEMQDAETGQRGYLLTGREDYLVPHTRARDSIQSRLARLDSLVGQSDAGRAQLATIRALTGRKFSELNETITLRRARGLQAAVAVVETDRGKLAMDAIRTALNELQRSESAMLEQRDAAERWAEKLTYLVLVLGGLGAVGVAILTNRRLARDAATQTQLAATIRQQHVDLAKQFRELEEQAQELADQQAELELSYEELQTTTEQLEERTEAAERAEAQAKRSNQATSSFLATMSHELRTPLNAIIGYSSLLEIGLPEPIPAGSLIHVMRVQTAARHLLGLIEEVLSFSRLDADREHVVHEAVKLQDIIDEVRVVIAPLAEQRGLDFRAEYNSDVDSIHTDPRKVRQILINLLGNAVKFTDRGTIVFECDSRNGWVGFVVRDTGIGIAPEHVEQVFDPFWQANAASDRPSGTGLGLAVARRLARLLGGDIELESALGVGTTFSVRLPNA
jgi:signal transduction histidine kinase